MRKTIIKEVWELNEREIELMLKDKTLREDILRYAHEMEELFIGEMFDYIRPYLSDYSISPYEHSYMKVANMNNFIYSLEDMQKDFGLFDDDMVEKLKLLMELEGEHISVEIGSDAYYDTMEDIEVYIDEFIKYLVGYFINILEYYDSFEKVEKESDFVTLYLENMYDRECLIDGEKVTLI